MLLIHLSAFCAARLLKLRRLAEADVSESSDDCWLIKRKSCKECNPWLVMLSSVALAKSVPDNCSCTGT